MSSYELEVVEDGAPQTVVALAGELDLTNAREVEERLRHSLVDGGRLVIDLNRVLFIDSAALHVLFRLSRELGAGGLTIRLERTAPVARTLEIVGVHEAMDVSTSATPPGTS